MISLAFCTLVAMTDKPNTNIETFYSRINVRNGSTVQVYRCPATLDPKKHVIVNNRPLREIKERDEK